ncbi:MAG: TRAP transporter small permease subunit [SAR324 cluster bacterium]|nr:TRAP transporter small permease subunit [SAR324 cluster bacterium]
MSLNSVLNAVERGVIAVSVVSAWLLIPLMIAIRVFDIVARRYNVSPSNLIQILEARAFFFLVFLSFGYAYLRNAHVRVDVLRIRFSPRGQAWMEIAGILLAVIPLGVVVIGYGIEYSHVSYLQGEREAIALGRPLQWVVKAGLPFGIGLLSLAGLVILIRNILFLTGRAEHPAPPES